MIELFTEFSSPSLLLVKRFFFIFLLVTLEISSLLPDFVCFGIQRIGVVSIQVPILCYSCTLIVH